MDKRIDQFVFVIWMAGVFFFWCVGAWNYYQVAIRRNVRWTGPRAFRTSVIWHVLADFGSHRDAQWAVLGFILMAVWWMGYGVVMEPHWPS